MNTNERTSEKTAICTDCRFVRELGAKSISRMKRFRSLGPKEQVLLLRTLFLVSAIRLGLFLFPFRVLQRLAQRGSGKSNAVNSADQYVWAIRAVSRYVPGATCLTQALAAQALLAQSGHESHIQIGVRKDEQCGFLAHAWVVCGDHIIIGGTEADGYVPLDVWKTRVAGVDKP